MTSRNPSHPTNSTSPCRCGDCGIDTAAPGDIAAAVVAAAAEPALVVVVAAAELAVVVAGGS